MDDFKDRMDMILSEDYGDNGIPYDMKARMKNDPDMALVHKLNIPLIRHLAARADYDGLGKYICGVINEQAMHHDDD